MSLYINYEYVFFEQLFTRGTFMGMSPINDAWDIAKSHPLIVNIDYDQLLILSRIYKHQENTFEPGFKMFELLNTKSQSRVNEMLFRERGRFPHQ